jgi:hypothetical protein
VRGRLSETGALPSGMVIAPVVVGLLTWGGTTLLIEACRRRDKRPDLAERLRPFHFDSVGDEAQRWLEEQA